MEEFIKRLLRLNNKIVKAPLSSLSESACIIFSFDEWSDLKDIMEFVLLSTEKTYKKEFKKVKKELEYD